MELYNLLGTLINMFIIFGVVFFFMSEINPAKRKAIKKREKREKREKN